jgi:hypothetical protein
MLTAIRAGDDNVNRGFAAGAPRDRTGRVAVATVTFVTLWWTSASATVGVTVMVLPTLATPAE